MLKIINKNYRYNEITIGVLFLYIGIVFFSIALSNIFLGLATFIFILGAYLKKIQLNFSNHNWKLYILIIVPFLLTLFSFFYSENTAVGLKYIWLRLPILIVPFIVVFMQIKTKIFKKGLATFLFFTVFASLKSIYNAIRYINEDVLFVPDFTFFITIIQHPYFGIFVLIAFIAIIEYKLVKIKSIKAAVFILFILAIALTTSRLVYLLFLIISGVYLFKKMSKLKLLFSILLLSIFTAAFVFSSKSLVAKIKNTYQYENSPRLKLWNNTYKVITSSNNTIFGMGIGDYYNNKKDLYFLKEGEEGVLGYNPHSQLVEFFATNGVIGVIIILSIIILGSLNIKGQDRFSIFVFLIVVMFSLTESIFSRQYGVQLYSVFIPLIFKKNFKKLR